MIDSDELLLELCGARKVAAFKEVKLTSMRLAQAVREVVADDLGGSLPARGKQFLRTPRGTWRLAARANSDNTTEEVAHRRMGVGLVQVFGELSEDRRARGWITVEEMYAMHGVKFESSALLEKVAQQLRRP